MKAEESFLKEPYREFSRTTMEDLCAELQKNTMIDASRNKTEIKRGLRNADGSGVMAGLTKICNVHGYVMNEGEKMPVPGRLIYRGVDIKDLVAGCQADGRFGYEETVWLLLFGELPTASQLKGFQSLLSSYRDLPEYFAEDTILKAPSPNIMNKMARAVMTLYSYDDNPDDTSMENTLQQSIQLIASMPTIMTYAYQVKRRYYDNDIMVFHPFKDGLSTSEYILYALRDDSEYTREEALLLDLCLMLHAEHGGGNNSTFTTRVLSSSGTDIYSAIGAAIGSLKGPRHGGANAKVTEMQNLIKRSVQKWEDEEEVCAFLRKIARREAGDGSGLIYGIGHAVYTMSDPRAELLKELAYPLAEKQGYGPEFRLLETIEKHAPAILAEERGIDKALCANVDMYSGLVYRALNIPPELFTPLFAVARMAGWCAHRMEELYTCNRIIRPAYKSVIPEQTYKPLNKR